MLAAPEGADARTQPAAGRRTHLGVVAGERRRQGSVAVAGGDAAQQVLVAAARGHPAHRDRHGRFRSTALRCASSSTDPSICNPCEAEKGWGGGAGRRGGMRGGGGMEAMAERSREGGEGGMGMVGEGWKRRAPER